MKELLEVGVQTDLGYYERCNALAGKIGDLGVVIKENNETKSYGCLIWVKSPTGSAQSELHELLSRQASAKPHIIKHFKATGRGAALALVKYNDAYRNIKNIKRFINELSEDLISAGFSNCCYQCGKTDDLAIYMDGASVIQLCPRCKKGELLCNIGTSPAPRPRPVPPPPMPADIPEDKPADVKPEPVKVEETIPEPVKVEETIPEPVKVEEIIPEPVKVEETIPEPAKVEEIIPEPVKVEETIPEPAKAEEAAPEAVHDELKELLADGSGESSENESDPDRKIISSNDDKTDISGLMAVDEPEEEKREVPKSELFEQAQREFEEQKRNEEPEKDDSLNSLMFDENEKKEEKPAAWGGMPVTEERRETETADIGGLMFDETEAPAAEEKEDKPAVPEEKADIGGLMLDADSIAEAEGEDYTAANAAAAREGATVTEVTALESGGGTGEDIVVTAADEEEVGENSEVEVTALYDDSNEGIDIQIEESVSTFGEPTDTSGELVTPTEPEKPAEQQANAPAGRKPMEVRAFSYGSYENATAAEEPVGFDGRRKNDKLSGDPRMGDEMGSRSRNYAMQQAASPVQAASKVQAPKVIEKPAAPGSKINTARYSNTYSGSSAVPGTVASILFGLIACAVWVLSGNIFDALGLGGQASLLIQSVLGVLVPIAAFVGYRIGGDTFDKKGVAISTIVSLVLGIGGLAAMLVTAEIRAAEARYSYGISLGSAIESVTKALGDPGTNPDVMQRLGIGCAAVLIALVISFIIAKKKS